MSDQFEKFKSSKFGQDIMQMSNPGKIALVLVLIQVVTTLFKKYKDYKTHPMFARVFEIARVLFFGVIYIFILNWLCSNNMCWASWVILCVQLVFVLITILMLFSIIGFMISLKDKVNKGNDPVIYG